MQQSILVSNDKLGDYRIRIEDGTIVDQVNLETLYLLGIAQEEIEEIDRGYEIVCETQAIELLWSLIEEEF